MIRNISTLLLSSIAVSASAAVLNITPGELSNMLSAVPAHDRTLIVRGEGDARDISTLQAVGSMFNTLDLSGMSITKFNAMAPVVYGRTYFEADALPPYALFDIKVKTLILPSDIRIIGEGALSHCDVAEIVIPEGVTTLGDYALYNMPSLRKVTLPSTLTSIGKRAFGNNPLLEDINLSDTQITSLPERCFAACPALEYLTLPATLQSIGREALLGTSITTLDASGVRTLAPYALSGMRKLEEVNLNANAKFGEGVLINDIALRTITGAPSTLPTLFAANCRNLSADISSTGLVGDFAFANTMPTSLFLSSGLSYIGSRAFAGITTLSAIYAQDLGSYVPDIDPSAFAITDPSSVPLWVDGEQDAQAWRQHPVWGQFDIRYNTQTDLEGVEATAIKFSLNDGTLTVTADEDIVALDVYLADGTVLHTGRPDATTATLHLGDIAQQGTLLLIKAATAHTAAATTLLY